MIKVMFSQNVVEALFRLRYEHHNVQVQKRMEALYLKSQGFKNLKIADVLQITRRTLQKWIHIFNKEGIEGLKKFHHKGQKSKLHGFSESIEEYFRSNRKRQMETSCRKRLKRIAEDYDRAFAQLSGRSSYSF